MQFIPILGFAKIFSSILYITLGKWVDLTILDIFVTSLIAKTKGKQLLY